MFKFKFQKALEYKEKLEDEAKERVRKKKEEEKLQIEKIEIMYTEKKDFLAEYEKKQHGKIDIAALTYCNNYLNIFEKTIKSEEKKLQELSLQVEKLQQDYFECVKERKIFEKLKEKDKEKYTAELEKEEQKLVDEISNNLFNRGR